MTTAYNQIPIQLSSVMLFENMFYDVPVSLGESQSPGDVYVIYIFSCSVVSHYESVSIDWLFRRYSSKRFDYHICFIRFTPYHKHCGIGYKIFTH